MIQERWKLLRFAIRAAFVAASVVWNWDVRAQQSGVFVGGQKFVKLTSASTNCGTLADAQFSGSYVPGPHQILEITTANVTAVNMYLHLYDLAVAPTAGTVPEQIGVYVLTSITATGGNLTANLGPLGASVKNGVAYCITGGLPLADATNAIVGGVVNFTVK